MKIPRVVKDFAKPFFKAGFECYLVGGAVRDSLLKRTLTDFDIATDATPLEVSRLFRRVIPTGVKHGTVTVLFKGEQFEVTTFRIEDGYSDGRRPDSVRFSTSIYDDLKRRDFTINGMAFDLKGRRLIDPHCGTADLKKKLIRAIGHAVDRFGEDALRTLRACRIAAQLAFEIEADTEEAIRETRGGLKKVSSERIRDELIKIIQAEDPVYGFELLEKTEILGMILPELRACIGIEQRELHDFDVFYHSLYACKAAPPDNLVLRLAALLHDIGKASTLFINEAGEPRFHNHEKQSAELSEELLRRLKFPNEVISRVSHLVRYHMFNYQEEWKDASVRRFVASVGKENLAELFALRRADQLSRGKRAGRGEGLALFAERIERVAERDSVYGLKDLAISGDEIMDRLSLESGPQIGIILNFLLESVLEDPNLNNPETLLTIAENFYRERLDRPG
jgi:poly(A) polymerase/tRNA nucleotidyltransferase (CCA-adding enzyme)